MNKNRRVAAATFSFIGALLLSLTISASAQTPRFQISAFTDRGGGTSSGESFTIGGTAGQSDAGTTSGGGRFGLSGGFWSMVPEPWPRLGIRREGNQVILSWPHPSTGFQLQETSALNSSGTGWDNVGLAPSVVGANKEVALTIGPSSRGFRLCRP